MAALTGSLTMISVAPAGANPIDIEITVNKEVVNPPQAQTQFTIKYSCSDGEDFSESGTKTLNWRQIGNGMWKLLPPQADFYVDLSEAENDVTCTISETNAGGATSSTITCDDADNATCSSSTTVTIDEEEDESATAEFTVKNDFTPAAPSGGGAAAATAVPAAPQVTG
ncbi:MAG: hypothetical protein ACKOA9_06940 [Actinomycetota bacterium]